MAVAAGGWTGLLYVFSRRLFMILYGISRPHLARASIQHTREEARLEEKSSLLPRSWHQTEWASLSWTVVQRGLDRPQKGRRGGRTTLA